ncbi:MAG: hypothetical protein NT027_08275 [Proteobacteria bacterium]|nr:hypothetical protein [Pseudomonadota bacterium]
MSNLTQKTESSEEPALSKESLELLEHIAEILAEKFVEAMKKKQSEDRQEARDESSDLR